MLDSTCLFEYLSEMHKNTLISMLHFPGRFIFSCLKAGAYLIRGKTRDKYCIKAQYLTQRKYLPFYDNSLTDQYQDEVYSAIKEFIVNHHLSSILDIGCGSGYKLIKYFKDYNFLGLELQPTLNFLKETYPDKRWELCNFNTPVKEQFDIVICIDVIEHLKDPDELMRFISQIDCNFIVLSTPDRDRLRFENWIGPPANPYHFREWNQKEFVSYVSKYFTVIESKIVAKHDHYCVAVKKATGHPL